MLAITKFYKGENSLSSLTENVVRVVFQSLCEELWVDFRKVDQESLLLCTGTLMKLGEYLRDLDDLRKMLRSQVGESLGKSCQMVSYTRGALRLPLQSGYQEGEGCMSDG